MKIFSFLLSYFMKNIFTDYLYFIVIVSAGLPALINMTINHYIHSTVKNY